MEMRLKIRDREFKVFSLRLFAGFVCCYFIVGSTSERKVTRTPLVVAPMLTVTQTASQLATPPMIWGGNTQVHAVWQPRPIVSYSTVRLPFAKGPSWGYTVQEGGPINGQATLDEMLDELNRRDLIDFRHSIDLRLQDLR